MPMTDITYQRLATGLAHPGSAQEVINQLNNLIRTVKDAITAFAGGGQASGTQIANMLNRVTIVASAADSVKLPVAVPGTELTIINAAAANSMNVFPFLGDAINALGANAAFAQAATKVVTFYCAVAGQWHTQLGA